MSVTTASARCPGPSGTGVMRRLMVFLMAAILTASCTAGFVYQRLDLLVAWYVNSYVSLDDTQEAQLRSAVRTTLDWHQKSQLPRYVAWIEAVADDARQPLGAAQIRGRYDEALTLLDDFLAFVTPALGEVFRDLSPAQLAELRNSLAEENDELWEEYAGDTQLERRERRSKAAEKAFRRFIGRLAPAQRQLITTRVAGLHELSDQWMRHRRDWQQQFLGLLESPPAGAAFGVALRDLALRPNQFDDGGYRLRVDENREAVISLVAEVSASLSDAQHRHLQAKLGDYAVDLRRLGETR